VTVLQLRLALLKLRAPYPSLIAAARPLARPRSPPTQTPQPMIAQPQTAQKQLTQLPIAQPQLTQLQTQQQTIAQPQTAQPQLTQALIAQQSAQHFKLAPAPIPNGLVPHLLFDTVNQPQATAEAALALACIQSHTTVAATRTPALVAGFPWSPALSDVNESFRVAEPLAASVRTQNQPEVLSEFRLIFDYRPILANLLAPDPGRKTMEATQHRLPQARPQGAFLSYPLRR
jgi:hypothetical protein